MKIREALSYDDVLIAPAGITEVKSRWDCETKTIIKAGGNMQHYVQPLIASPMSTVCDVDMCIEMANNKCIGILHRGHPYEDINNKLDAVQRIRKALPYGLFGVAIGSQEKDFEDAKALIDAGVEIICVDVANGHNRYVARFVEKLKSTIAKFCHVMAGNVATADGFKLLANSGADSVRAGIGGGSVCATSANTAIGLPTLQSIIDCAELRDAYHTYSHIAIIADGGAKSSGDVAKAIAAGADFVMCGSLFAGTSKSPGELMWLNKATEQVSKAQPTHRMILSVPGHINTETYVVDKTAVQVKKYEGMASFNVQVEQGRDETKIVPEGVSTYVKYSGETNEMVKLLLGGLRSAMSYCNATTLEQFRLNAEFVRVTNAGLAESKPHSIRL